jgi:hypothetical protein
VSETQTFYLELVVALLCESFVVAVALLLVAVVVVVALVAVSLLLLLSCVDRVGVGGGSAPVTRTLLLAALFVTLL